MSQAKDTHTTTPAGSIAGSAASKTSPALKAPDRIDRRKALAVVAGAPAATGPLVEV